MPYCGDGTFKKNFKSKSASNCNDVNLQKITIMPYWVEGTIVNSGRHSDMEKLMYKRMRNKRAERD